MAAFYLLLITGMYACIVSCGSNHVKEFLTTNILSTDHKEESETHCDAESEKHCDGDEDCSCCDKHGNYTVKENIKPDNNFELLEIPALAQTIAYHIFSIDFAIQPTLYAWPNSHAPPPGISPPIYIKFRSLLI